MYKKRRLLSLISKNLYTITEVKAWYGDQLDEMLSYSSANLQQELADALNSGDKYDEIVAEDFDGYNLIHTAERLEQFYSKFGIRASLFDIEIGSQKWERLKEKTDIVKWAGGVYFTGGHFRKFKHPYLEFRRFGLAIEEKDFDFDSLKKTVIEATGHFGPYCMSPTRESLYNHEALHAAKTLYTKNHNSMTGWSSKKRYDPFQMRAKVEMTLLDELICQMCTGVLEGNLRQSLKKFYLPKIISEICKKKKDKDVKKKWMQRRKEKKQLKKEKKHVGKILMPVRDNLRNVVQAAFFLKETMGEGAIVPLLFSFGPTLDEQHVKDFVSPFSDLLSMVDLIDYNWVSKDELMNHLWLAGYCRD